MRVFNLSLTEGDVNLVLNALGEQKFHDVVNIHRKISDQVIAKIQADQEAANKAANEVEKAASKPTTRKKTKKAA